MAPIGSPVEGAAAIRVRMEPDGSNGLQAPSDVMVDAILPVRQEPFGRHVGHLRDEDMPRVERALMMFLGLGAAR